MFQIYFSAVVAREEKVRKAEYSSNGGTNGGGGMGKDAGGIPTCGSPISRQGTMETEFPHQHMVLRSAVPIAKYS